MKLRKTPALQRASTLLDDIFAPSTLQRHLGCSLLENKRLCPIDVLTSETRERRPTAISLAVGNPGYRLDVVTSYSVRAVNHSLASSGIHAPSVAEEAKSEMQTLMRRWTLGFP